MSPWQEEEEEKKLGSIGFSGGCLGRRFTESVERLRIARAAISYTGCLVVVGDLESGFKVVGSCGLSPGTLAAAAL